MTPIQRWPLSQPSQGKPVLSQNLPHNVCVLAGRGEIIAAIKELRVFSTPQLSLKEAKDIVDRYADTVLAERQFAVMAIVDGFRSEVMSGSEAYKIVPELANLLKLEAGESFQAVDEASPERKERKVTRIIPV